jgi:hypothetical protein
MDTEQYRQFVVRLNSGTGEEYWLKEFKPAQRYIAIDAAIRAGDKSVLKRLLDLGASPTPPRGYLSHVEIAADNDSFECIDVLLQYGASIERRGPSGHTPLQYFARDGNARAVRLLLERGADPNALVEEDGESLTASQVAQRCGHEAIARFLLAAQNGEVEDSLLLETDVDRSEAAEGSPPGRLLQGTQHEKGKPSGIVSLLPIVLGGLVFFFIRDLNTGDDSPLFLVAVLAFAVIAVLLLFRHFSRKS